MYKIWSEIKVAQMEYELRVQSLPSIPEFGYDFAPQQPSWISRQTGKMLTAFRNGLMWLGQHAQRPSSADLNGQSAETSIDAQRLVH